ncbi:MAG: RNA-binding protein [Flavipsychrobacter sp.]|nr:RNA-binding protein [Flavipsychrobacter sp.]
MNILVGNLGNNISEQNVRELFAQYGTVTSVNIMMDFKTRQPKGYGFVEMSDRGQAEKAINKLNNFTHHGVLLEVSEARPKSASRNDQHFTFRNIIPPVKPDDKKGK